MAGSNYKKCIITILLLTAAFSGQAQKDTIRNAYQAAKAWARLNTDSLLDEQLCRRLLGSLIWYADVQDDPSDNITHLLEKLTRYPLLYAKAKKVYFTVYPINSELNKDDSILKFIAQPHKNAFSLLFYRHRNIERALGSLDTQERRTYNYLEYKQLTNQKDSLAGMQFTKNNYDIRTSLAAVGKLLQDPKYSSAAQDSALPEKLPELRAARDSMEKEIDMIETAEITMINTYPLAFTNLRQRNKAKVQAYSSRGQLREMSQDFARAKEEMAVTYMTEVSAPQAFHIPSESEMIDAVAIYLAKRMKQETIMWFFETISRNAKAYDLIRVFFPNTLKLLSSNEVYEIPNMGAQWQYALSKDFVTMPENVLRSKWLNDRCKTLQQYKSFIEGTTAMAAMMQDRYSYREIIARLYLDRKEDTERHKEGISFDQIIGLQYAINTELYVPAAQGYRPLKYDDYRTMDANQLEIMISLLDMKYHGIFSQLLNGMQDTLKLGGTVKAEDIRILLGKVEQATTRVEAMRAEYAKEMASQRENNRKDWQFTTYNVWTAASQMWSIFDEERMRPGVFSPQLVSSRKAFWYTGEIFEVYNLISKKNYSGAVNNTLLLIDSMLYSVAGGSVAEHTGYLTDSFSNNSLLWHVNAELNKAGHSKDPTMRKGLERRYGVRLEADSRISFAKNSPMAAIVFEKDRHAIQQIRKLAAFLNDAALAQSDKQLARAIESYALPPGSYRRKRNSWYSLDLNAFAGAYGGMEGLFRQQNSADNYEGVTGLSAPIGLTFSKTFGKRKCPTVTEDYINNPDRLKLTRRHIKYRSHWNLAMTFSLVDIGAVVSYRLSNNTTEALPREVKWEQFLAPGLHFGLSIPSTPLVLMAGVQFNPKLRKIDEADAYYNTFRIYTGIFFDLPLINLWEKKRIAY